MSGPDDGEESDGDGGSHDEDGARHDDGESIPRDDPAGGSDAGRSTASDETPTEQDETPADLNPFGALDDGAPAEEHPFEALAADEATADDAPGDDPFTEMEVGVDGVRPAARGEGSGSVSGEGVADVEPSSDERVVPTRSFCERCEHFAAPPQVACEHPGTEIREVVDVDHVLVANCPVVAERLDRTLDDER